MRLALVLTTFLLLGANFFAADIKLTIYNDGLSCPAGCDAHVVFHPSMNGTKYAHAPTSTAGRFDKCTPNTECRICFAEGPRECMNVMYRGGGPPPNTFDFTPAFYEKYCSQTSIPSSLATECSALKAKERSLDGRVNCIRDPEHAKCVELIRSAKQQQTADRPNYEQCRRMGEGQFNSQHITAEQRSEGCAYEKRGTGGPNSKGKTWRRLLPGACRDNSYVGRDGLDCCSGLPLTDSSFGVECQGFYPRP